MFDICISKRDGYVNKCKSCINISNKQYYQNNCERIKEYNRSHYHNTKNDEVLKENRKISRKKYKHKIKTISQPKQRKKKQTKQDKKQFVNAHKCKPCFDCGIILPPDCLDFDHRDPTTKHRSISFLAKHNCAITTIMKEIEKCDLVCVNCHRKRTYNQQSTQSKKYPKQRNQIAMVNSYKILPCIDCGNTYETYQMDFDHIPGTQQKIATISQMINWRSFTNQEIIDEISKCELVCANCHRIRTMKRLIKE